MDKAQVFYTDLMISIAIFGVSVVLFLVFSSNLQPQGNVFETLVGDSNSIAASLLSSGEPPDWTQDDVTKIGLTDNYRLNITKVEKFMNLSPSIATGLFGTNANYVVFFKDKHGNVLNLNGCTFNNVDLTVNNLTATTCENFTITPENHLVSVERLVMYNTEIIKIIAQAWI